MAGLERKIKARRRQDKQAEKRAQKAAKKQERRTALEQRESLRQPLKPR
jgi:hypothetical protein